MRTFVVFLVAFVAISFLLYPGGEIVGAIEPNPSVSKPVTSSDVAGNRSSDLVGSDRLNPMIEPSGVTNDQAPKDVINALTPYRGGHYKASMAWRIEYDSIGVGRGMADSIARAFLNCTVWIDSLTGRFLLARLQNLSVDRSVEERLPTAEETTLQLGFLHQEYHGQPDVEPSVSMLDALKNYKSITTASEIYVHYVLFSKAGLEKVPVWVVYMRGLPRLPIHSDDVGPATTTLRMVVNAITGEIINPISNRPVPDARN